MSTPPLTLQQFPADATQAYGEVEFARLDRKLAMFNALAAEDRALLPEYDARIETLASCIQSNVAILSDMAASAASIGASAASEDASDARDRRDRAVSEHDKHALARQVRHGFELLARDWSAVGEKQRATCYAPVVAAVQSAYEDLARASKSMSRERFRVLVPAAGAGRLAWELVKCGFAVEGCEQSYSALMVGNYALNHGSEQQKAKIYPFVHVHSNVRSVANATLAVEIPDVDPKDIPQATNFAMRAGSFVESYDGQDNVWDAVASCLAFTLGDRVVEHVRRVSQLLKPGGVWTFVGPAPAVESAPMQNVHVSVEEFLSIVRQSGFKITTESRVQYQRVLDPNSMQSVYIHCPFIVAVKVRRAF